MGLIGLLGAAASEPWLFPSLGPTIFMQTVMPEARASKAWSVLVGHSVGVVAGYAAVFICCATMSSAGPALHGPSAPRILATMLAITGTMAGQRLLRAMHPPAAATTMLVALGSFPATLRSLAAIAAGVILVCIVGEVIRCLRRRMGKRLG
jgi:hypothetical protein